MSLRIAFECKFFIFLPLGERLKSSEEALADAVNSYSEINEADNSDDD